MIFLFEITFSRYINGCMEMRFQDFLLGSIKCLQNIDLEKRVLHEYVVNTPAPKPRSSFQCQSTQ